MEQSPQILLVNRSIIIENDRMLVLRRSLQDRRHPGLWEFPGGKIDAGEDVDTGLKREIFEETGLHIEPDLGLSHVESELITSGRYEGKIYVALFRIARRLSGEVTLSDEHEESSWDTFGEIINRDLSPESRKAVVAFRRSHLL